MDLEFWGQSPGFVTQHGLRTNGSICHFWRQCDDYRVCVPFSPNWWIFFPSSYSVICFVSFSFGFVSLHLYFNGLYFFSLFTYSGQSGVDVPKYEILDQPLLTSRFNTERCTRRNTVWQRPGTPALQTTDKVSSTLGVYCLCDLEKCNIVAVTIIHATDRLLFTWHVTPFVQLDDSVPV